MHMVAFCAVWYIVVKMYKTLQMTPAMRLARMTNIVRLLVLP